MAGEDLHPFATVPHGFHFHYTDGSAPKTPEREENNPSLPSPPRGGFRIKRRVRPRINTSLHSQPTRIVGPSQDIPIPTIETPDMEESFGPALQQRNPEPIRGLLSPPAGRSLTAPRTPSPQPCGFQESWNGGSIKAFGESIVRSTSAFSISDSSDESDYSSEDRFSYGGSCTSPDSDTTDPFVFPSPKKSQFTGHLHSQEPSPDLSKNTGKARMTAWTAEMDKHLWTVYMTYLQDPTVTPFKTFPGSPPPLGVCHRVAREAKRTWRRGKAILGRGVDAANEPKDLPEMRNGTPDTITAEKSGSSTPTSVARQKSQKWPKSGSATRRRLRELCKRKPPSLRTINASCKAEVHHHLHRARVPARKRPSLQVLLLQRHAHLHLQPEIFRSPSHPAHRPRCSHMAPSHSLQDRLHRLFSLLAMIFSVKPRLHGLRPPQFHPISSVTRTSKKLGARCLSSAHRLGIIRGALVAVATMSDPTSRVLLLMTLLRRFLA